MFGWKRATVIRSIGHVTDEALVGVYAIKRGDLFGGKCDTSLLQVAHVAEKNGTTWIEVKMDV